MILSGNVFKVGGTGRRSDERRVSRASVLIAVAYVGFALTAVGCAVAAGAAAGAGAGYVAGHEAADDD